MTDEEFEELWRLSKQRDEKLNSEWDKLSEEEKKELLDDPLYQRMRYEFDDREKIDPYEDL
jgi:hypothetical protein